MQPNPNYEAEARRKQEEQERMKYQQSRDPFKYGQEVARRRYSEIMSGLAERQRQSARSYSDMYQAARQTAVGQRAAGPPSLSGGMGAQYSDLVSAREMQQLGAIGAQRESAAREIDLQRQSAFANAQLEGQQAQQTQLQAQQTQLELIRQRNEILATKDLTDQQKAEQLSVLGYEKEAQDLLSETERPAGDASAAGLTALAVGTLGLAKVTGLTKFLGGTFLAKMGSIKGLGWLAKGLTAVGAVGTFKLVIGAALIGSVLYGVEKLIIDPENKNNLAVEKSIDKFLGVST